MLFLRRCSLTLLVLYWGWWAQGAEDTLAHHHTLQLGSSCLAAVQGDWILKKGKAGVQTEVCYKSRLSKLTMPARCVNCPLSIISTLLSVWLNSSQTWLWLCCLVAWTEVAEFDHTGCVSNTAAVHCWRSSITLTPNTDKRFTRPMSQHTRPHPAVSQDQFRASGLCSTAPDCFSFIWESSLLPPLQGQNVEWICLLQHMEEIHQIGKNMKVGFFLRFMEGRDYLSHFLLPLILKEWWSKSNILYLVSKSL